MASSDASLFARPQYISLADGPKSILSLTNTVNGGGRNSESFNNKQPSIVDRLALFERVGKENKASDFRGPVTPRTNSCDNWSPAYSNGYSWDDNEMSQVFFSVTNQNILQNGMRSGVYHLSDGKYSIPAQNADQLMTIMRSVYYRYAKYEHARSMYDQIAELNTRVLDFVVPFLYNEAIAYTNYLRDKSTLVLPLDLPKQVDRDYKDLREIRF